MNIISKRNFHNGGAHHIVYMWEDSFTELLGVKIVGINGIIRFIDKVLTKLNLNFLGFFNTANAFYFSMVETGKSNMFNARNVIPCVVDFYIEENNFNQFFKSHSRNPVVLISSMEVFEKLKRTNHPDVYKYKHLPLSLPDKYRITGSTKFEKKYDLILLGRQDSLLESFVKKYEKRHTDFNYLYRKAENGGFSYIDSKKGFLFNSNRHDDYVNLTSLGKVSLYSTRGLMEKSANGYNQLTPRFLELLSSGCHVIMRYPENEDTKFYKLSQFGPSCESYDLFESLMDKYLKLDVDMNFYSNYLENHYTSVRVEEFNHILKTLGIKI
jgi:hypothetical protein